MTCGDGNVVKETRSDMVRKRVAVLYGGRADEHSISCVSTAGVLGAMDRERFDPVPVGITKDGRWIVGGDDPRGFRLDADALPTVERTARSRDVVLDPSRGGDGFLVRNPDGTVESLGHIDVVFPVLHGPYGEDGTVQGLLEMMSVPYVGCGVLTSAVCMDKHYTKLVLSSAGIPVAPGITVDMRRVDLASGQGATRGIAMPSMPWASTVFWRGSMPRVFGTRFSSSRRGRGRASA
ncbi:D-alanyl-alanine synthetase A [Bifidobacterium minimum]|uniref:D-alanyl-alanine synthetase A n=1 Tax=Bifidobacterium minimum TaxID=1693 RepID=A0A087BRE8_9BIFI|nr:D-alanyl-alanine synthetase A [Bifidobacterium minimum]